MGAPTQTISGTGQTTLPRHRTIGAAMQAVGRAVANPGLSISAAGDLTAGSDEIFEAALTVITKLDLKNVEVKQVASHIEVVAQ